MSEAIIEKVRQFAESHFADDGSGHDWWHVHRVWNTAKHLADAEGADRTIVEIAALLHDVADWKLNEDESQGLNTIRELLAGDLPPATVDRICDIISKVSFKGAGVDTPTERFVWNAVRRTDGRARHLALGKFAAGTGANQRDIATNSPVPLAIVCGADDAFIRNDYITGLNYANLWEDQVYLLKGLDHAPFYEAPARFDPYLDRFLTDMNRDRGN